MSLSGTVSLADIRDVDAFVNAAINRLGLTLTRDEREELELDGFEIMCDLHRRFTPTPGGSFSGYATEFLPRRLLTAWHKANRGRHVRTRDHDGRCVWEYRAPTLSLDQLLDQPEDDAPRRTFDETRVTPITRFQRPARPVVAIAA